MDTIELITTICSFIVGVSSASIVVTKVVTRAVKKTFQPVYEKIDQLDKTQCQNYLIDFLSDVERGIEKDESQWEHAHKMYDHYIKELKGNSYVHDKWVRVTQKGVKYE